MFNTVPPTTTWAYLTTANIIATSPTVTVKFVVNSVDSTDRSVGNCAVQLNNNTSYTYDASSNWPCLSNVGMPSIVSSTPNLITDPTSSIDIGNTYYTFSNNSNLSAASNIAHSNILSTDFTIESWVYYYQNPLNPFYSYMPTLIGNMNPSTVNGYWSAGVNANSQLVAFYMWANDLISTGIYTQSNAIQTNTWTHIAVSYSNNEKAFRFYVRGNHTIGTNDMKHGHSYSVCITNSNGEPNVIKATRYRQNSLNYIRSPLNVSPDMESKEKDLSCDNEWTRNNL